MIVARGKSGQIVSCESQLERFLKFVQVGPWNEKLKSFCWVWTGTAGKKGYGRFYWDKKERYLRAHVAAYRLFVGGTKGRHVHHKCERKTCVNYSQHLSRLTPLEHRRAHIKKSKPKRCVHCGRIFTRREACSGKLSLVQWKTARICSRRCPALIERKKRCLSWRMQGLSFRQIGSRLGVAHTTVMGILR